jgi:hypothetical protein
MKLWKVQKVLGDVVYDLRSRGLLPVAILLVVAMVAVPVLISQGGSGSSVSSIQPTAVSTKAAPEAQNAVVSYSPGVRDYKKRLDDLAAKDPFRQKVAPSDNTASELNSTVTTPTVTGSSSTPTVATTPVGSSGASSPGGTRVRRYFFYSVADLSVGDVTQPLVRHRHIKPFTSLPNPIAPVLIYLGSSLDGKRAYFSLSKSADQLTGAGTCVPSPTDCSLLALSAGQTEDMVYSVDGMTYRVKINKINRVVSKG